jgi:pimeloyl-ACP methyl ester carboxylesterase
MVEQFAELSEDVALCYETFGQPDAPPLLLIMGLGTQMVAWPEPFCESLAERGFYVIRYDNRDCGRSSPAHGRPPSIRELLRRRIDHPPYTLSDLADDAAGLLDALKLGSAHIVGISMGGMIAQTLAIERPERVRSLVSMMSTTGHRRKGQPALSIYRYLLRAAPREREAFIDRTMQVYDAIGSRALPRDLDRLRAVAALSFERGINPAGTGRQLGAIVASGDRTPALRRLSVPTLVIHGTRDPMVNLSGGRATAEAIPGAELMLIEGMGHDLPDAAWPRLIEAIARHAAAAEETLTGSSIGGRA